MEILDPEAIYPETREIMGQSIHNLREIGKRIEKLEPWNEEFDYHWEIIGNLVDVIACVFDYIEGKSSGLNPEFE